MLIVMKTNATDRQVEAVFEAVNAMGFRAHPMPGAMPTAIGVTGNQGAVDVTHFENLDGVVEVIRVTKPYGWIDYRSS
jgi:3-deoxy-7-phosphoheptulonate synthase